MPKDTTARPFRKGTKSCVECRQRKLKCDGTTPCHNCRSHERNCVLQTEVARASDAFKTTSRDRISNLEDEVGSLWAVVRELKAELGHKDETPAYREHKTFYASSHRPLHPDDDSVDSQEDTPGNAPAHLQQLFDGGIFQDHEPTSVSPFMELNEAVSPEQLAAATRKLQSILPPRHDVQILAEHSAIWVPLYEALFPTANVYKSSSEMLARYESAQAESAHPCAVALSLLVIAITVQQAPESAILQLRGIKDAAIFPGQVSAVVEDVIVNDNALGGTVEGLEASLLFIRLQLVRARIKKVWLLLRRIIALAELSGIPRAASSIRSMANPDEATAKQRAAAQLWQSICVTDRISGMMLNLPCGTASYPFPKPEVVFAPDGKLVPNALFSALAAIAQQVLEVDDLHISGADDTIVLQKVLSVDSELRHISNLAPAEWWSMPTSQLSADHVLQYWHQYFTIRTHLACAMKSKASDQFAYSRSVTIEASRSVGLRYIQLRDKLPPGFFAGRILDLQSLTATVFLLHSIYSESASQQPKKGSVDEEDLDLVRRVTVKMESVSHQPVGDVARLGSKALKSMLDHFANPEAIGQGTLTLRVPMLGKVHINRKRVRQPAATPGVPAPQVQQAQANDGRSNEIPGYFVPQEQHNGQFGVGTNDVDMMNWSMDLMGDFPFMTDDPYANGDSWLWFDNWSSSAQPQYDGRTML